MKLLNRFEYNLLKLLQFFCGRLPTEHAAKLIATKAELPDALTTPAMRLLKDHLAKGCTLYLAKRGGWQPDTYLREQKIKNGRLWNRSEPKKMGLDFSAQSLRFMMWITAYNPADTKAKWCVSSDELTIGDWVLFYMAYLGLRKTEFGKPISDNPGFVNNPLIRLMCPEDFAQHGKVKLDYTPWVKDSGAFVIEALQLDLADSWIITERTKANIKEWEKLHSLGESQAMALDAFLPVIEKANRRDLARFLMKACSKVLTHGVDPKFWNNTNDNKGKLSDRAKTIQASVSLIRQMERFSKWQQEAITVGFYEDEYERTQLMKAEWERWNGDNALFQSQRIIKELDPMKVTETPAATPNAVVERAKA